MSPLFERWRIQARRLAVARGGFSAVLTALALTMLMGFVGLAIDVGMWQWTQRDMQEAADHAAYAAAQSDVALNPGFGGSLTQGTPNDYSASIQTGFSVAVAGLGLNPATFTSTGPPPQAPTSGQCYSSQLAAQQGYSAADNIVQICVIYGQATGQNNNYAWQVTIAQPRPMWFSKILFSTAGTIGVSATAEPKNDNPRSCVIATAPATTVPAFVIDGTAGTANVTLTNCDTLVSSNYTDALETASAANFSARAVYVGGGESNGGLTFNPGPGAAQNYQNLANFTPPALFLSTVTSPSGGDPYYVLNESPRVAPPAYTGAPSGTPPGTPSPTGGKLGNGCDYYTGDYVPTGQSVADGIHVNLPPAGTSGSALANYDGPGVYCQNASNPNSPPNFVPWDGSMMPSGLYVLYGVGMQLPSSSATMTYTCQNSGDTYSSTTGTCNNAQGKPQADAAWGQCSGGGVNATGGVTIYVMPSPASGTNQVQLTPYGGTGSTCFAITAPQYTQIEPSSCLLSCVPLWTAPTNFSSNYAGVSGLTLASDLEGMAIWVSGSMSSSVSDSIGPNASIAINGAVYDPARTLYVGATSSGVAGTSVTTLTGTGSTLNASGATNCSQVEASQVTVKGPANVDLAFCTYTVGNTSYTYIRNPDYNYLGSVELVQ